MRSQHRPAWLLLLAALAAGCGKTGQSEHEGPTTTSTGGSGAGTGTGTGTGGSSSGGGAGGTADVPLKCDDPHPGPAPLSRLTSAELNRSVLARIPAATPSQALPWLPDASDAPYSNVSAVLAEQIHHLAHEVALLLTDASAGVTAFDGCDVATDGEATCRDQFVTRFLERAYRRPVTDEDHTEMNEVFTTGQQLGGDFKSGARAVIEVALQNPDFVYLLELGSAETKGDAVALTGFETAARLAYFLTGGPPDEALFAAAKDGAFSANELQAQARRLIGSGPNRALVVEYYKRLFNLGPREAFPDLGYTNEIAKLADEETSRFIEDVTFDGAGTFSALISQPSTWVNEPLARFYGYTGVTGDAFQKVQLDPKQRLGLFTQASFLRSFSRSTHPVQRSVTILRKVLCYDTPLPPPDVIAAVVVPETPPQATMRQALTTATEAPTCQTCHRDINPVGFAFEHYDAVGKWRDLENGVAIDSTGELYQTDAKGPFADAPELLARIADSADAKKCLVGHWLGQAYRRDPAPEDACSKAELSKAFLESDGKVVELLAALAKSDNFRYRLKSELAP